MKIKLEIISPELRYFMLRCGKNFSKGQMDDMIKEADVDNDGFIDYNEFAKFVNKYIYINLINFYNNF